MDLKQEQFSAGEIGRILRVNDAILQNFVRRSKLEQPSLIGGRRLFSAEFAIQLAIFRELNHYGAGPSLGGEVVEMMIYSMHGDWLKWLESMTGNEVVKIGLSGNALEDITRSAYRIHPGVMGEPLYVEVFPNTASVLTIAIGAIVTDVLKQLSEIVRLRKITSA